MLSAPAWADSEKSDQTKAKTDANQEAIERITNVVRARLGVDVIDSISPSQVPDMYELFIGGQLFYVTASGRYLFQGGVLDMLTETNLTEKSVKQFQAQMAPLRKARLDEYPDDKTVIFGPDKPRFTITVATDVSCGYCRKFHREMSQLTESGVRVRYLLFPRSGLGDGSSSYLSMQSVWCSENRADSLTRVKFGEQIESAKCENPIAEHLKMAKDLGVSGTPTIFTETGQIIPGYLPAKKLVQTLESELLAKKQDSPARD